MENFQQFTEQNVKPIIEFRGVSKTYQTGTHALDDVNIKMNKVNGVFNIIDKTTDYASTISDKVIGSLSKFINSLIYKKKGNDDDE